MITLPDSMGQHLLWGTYGAFLGWCCRGALEWLKRRARGGLGY